MSDTKTAYKARTSDIKEASADLMKSPARDPVTVGGDSEIVRVDKEYLKSRILDCIEQYKIDYNTDILSYSQIQWNHVLDTIRDTVIIPLHIDYRNIHELIYIRDIYIELCHIYNKSSSIYGYAIISNIPYNTLRTYNSTNKRHNILYDRTTNNIVDTDYIGTYKTLYRNHVLVELPNDSYNLLVKNIRHDREHALTDKAENGSVMSLALGKIEYGWIEGKDKQIAAEILQQSYSLPDDILNKYD